MMVKMLKSKLHRATVTDADLNYVGSVSIDPKLIEAAGLYKYEQVDVYNLNNGERFTTYVIEGKEGEVCLNGAAARLVHRGDIVIIASYADFTTDEAPHHKPIAVFVDAQNQVKEIKRQS